MSTIRDPATITKVGRQMMTAGGDITYTKATLYGQDISHLTKDQLESLTSIGNPLVTVPLGISDKSDNGNGTTVILEATFQNSNLKADLPYTAVGFFAKRGDEAEKLVAVGVATNGAYLAATSPDGIATDALDIKVAIAIGDSANVTAMIDPAGSVTPTELHNSITDVKTEMHTALDLKADKVDLEPLAKTADVQASLDTKANKTAVDSDVKSINDTLATKADKQTVTDDLATKADKTDVDAQIGTVNKSVSDLSDTVKANKDDTDKVLATKADKATVESELSTKANQSDLDKTNAEVAKKASTTDVNSQLATKADAKDVTDALALKDDTVDVDKKISNVTNSVNSLSSTVTSNKSATDTALGTKANANDVANSFEEVRNRVKKLEGQQELTAPDFNTLTSTGIYMIENPTDGKNSPSNVNWGTLVVSRGTTGSDSRILQEYYPDSGDLPYFRMSGPGGVWRDWKQLSDQSEINSLRDAVNTKADKTDVAKDIDTVNKSISSMSATITANQKATDSTLATKANASDVADSLATKADKTDVASDVKSLNDAINTKASQADLDKTNAVVATKANATALADYARTVDVDADLDTKANKTDLESLAKTADVNSALDTKADKATVNSDIKTINDTMATKADKTTVDGDVKTLQASIDTKADKTALADYAKSADVASDVKTLTDSIATKADAKTVNDAISKIDFTPYAKSADVDSKLKGYTDTADLTKLLAGKADSDFSYSKAELDKKLLDLTTTTGGKVDASQVATMIENKADKSDVTKQIGAVTDLVNTKANSTDVTAALDKKDDITDVDAKIKTVTDAVNIKANSSDVNNQITSINKALSQLIPDETHAPELSAGFDLNSSFVGWRRSVNKKLKNAPFGWVNDMIIFQGTVAGADGRFELALHIGDTESTNPKIAYRYFGWNKWKPWVLLADNGDISDVRNQISANIDKLNQAINTKANSSDVYTKSDVDYRTCGTVITDYDIASLTPTKEKNIYRNRWLVDQNVLPQFAKQINQLKGRQNVDAPDFNNLTDTGVYYVSDSKYKGMTNGPNNNWGVLVVSNGSNNRISQVYYPDSDVPPWMRVKSDTWHNWIQLSTKSDVQNAVNLANSASNKIDTVLANSYVRKQGMNANGDCVEIKHTGIKQANGGYAFDMWSDDWTALKLNNVIKNQLPSKANTTDVNNALNGKANTGDVTALQNKVNVNTPLFREISADSTWEDIFGVTNPSNVLTSLRINPGGSGQLVNDFAAGIGFGGNDTKAVITVDYGSHVARFTAGNGTAPGWSEDVAWKSDINSTNQTVSALQQTIKTLNDTINSANATIKTLQDTITKQDTTITGLQTQVSNQANEISYIKANYIEGKRFAKSDEESAEAWEKANPQRIAFIEDE